MIHFDTRFSSTFYLKKVLIFVRSVNFSLLRFCNALDAYVFDIVLNCLFCILEHVICIFL